MEWLVILALCAAVVLLWQRLTRAERALAALAERQVRVLMGSKSEPRKHWISEHVHFGDDVVTPVPT